MGTKAFEKDMTCRGKQYAENTVFEEPDADLCRVGIHFCENPFDVLKFYDLIDSGCNFIVTAKVEPLGTVKTDGTKSVTDKIRIGEKQAFADFIQSGIDYIKEHTKVDADGANSDGGVNFAQIGSSGYGAQIGSSGDGARIGSSGDGARIGSSGENCVICCAGHGCRVKAKKGSWITLAEWKYDEDADRWVPACVKTEFVDGVRIKADTSYMLQNGVFVEVTE